MAAINAFFVGNNCGKTIQPLRSSVAVGVAICETLQCPRMITMLKEKHTYIYIYIIFLIVSLDLSH